MSAVVLPQIDELNRPFWEGCRLGRLLIQRCESCGRLRYPISVVCPACMGLDFAWEPCSGGGEVYSFTVFRHAYNDAWRQRVPYVVALVELDEGPMMLSNVVDIPPEEVRVGMAVAVSFNRLNDAVTLPVFTPRRG